MSRAAEALRLPGGFHHLWVRVAISALRGFWQHAGISVHPTASRHILEHPLVRAMRRKVDWNKNFGIPRKIGFRGFRA